MTFDLTQADIDAAEKARGVPWVTASNCAVAQAIKRTLTHSVVSVGVTFTYTKGCNYDNSPEVQKLIKAFDIKRLKPVEDLVLIPR